MAQIQSHTRSQNGHQPLVSRYSVKTGCCSRDNDDDSEVSALAFVLMSGLICSCSSCQVGGDDVVAVEVVVVVKSRRVAPPLETLEEEKEDANKGCADGRPSTKLVVVETRENPLVKAPNKRVVVIFIFIPG